MPYKVEGNTVYVKKKGEWSKLKEHPSHAAALKHLRALLANVEEAVGSPEAVQKLIAVFNEIQRMALEQSNLERLAALRGRGPGRRPRWEDFVNDYQRELGAMYDDWMRDLSAQLDGVTDFYDQRMIIDAALSELESLMVLSGRDALFEGYAIGLTGLEFDRLMLSDVGFLMTLNENFITYSLLPDLRRKLVDAVTNPDFVLVAASFLALLGAYQSRVESYAGSAWAAIMQGVGQIARDNLQAGYGRVRWVLERMAQHCVTCLTYGNRTYDSYDLMLQATGGVLPALGTECRTNCRCHLEIENADGEFYRP